MKKFISLFLALIILLCGVQCAFAASVDSPMKVLVASDLHWKNVSSVNPDGFYSPHGSFGQLTALTPCIVRQFLAEAAETDADYVFLSGDLTDKADVSDAESLAQALADFEESTGKSVYVVRGNHDIQKGFRDIFAEFGYDEALVTDENTLSYTADLKNGYRLLAIDSNEANSGGGGFISADLLDWIGRQVEAAKADNKKLVAMMHHHLLEHITMESKIAQKFIIRNFEEVAQKFAEWNIRYTFTGHLHMGDIASFDGENTIYDVTGTSLACYPLSYRSVSFAENEVVFESKSLESLDLTGVVPGYSDEQLEMIANDSVGYSYETLHESLIETKIKQYMSADKIIQITGLDPASDEAEMIRKYMPDLLIPLYGEGNTVEAKAKALGYDFPSSDYETVDDVITVFVAAMARGDENLGGSSPEGRLMIDIFYTLFMDKASEENEYAAALISSKVVAALGLKGVDNIFTRSALDLILTGFTVDKAPADNDVTLPGYDEAPQNNFMQKIVDFLKTIVMFFKRVFTQFFPA